MTVNRRILLASRPQGEPTEDNFRLEETDAPSPQQGELLLRTIYLSLDPYMRGRMNDAKSYADPVQLGAVMEGEAVCEVVESKHPQFSKSDIVVARSGWQEYAVVDGGEARKFDPKLGPLSYGLGVLGMPGMTAYTGLLNIGQPKEGETLVVAAASGAVGSVVGQIGRIKGCRVIGVAGGDEKCRYVREELGFDECLDRKAKDFPDQLKQVCPDGIDIYFESVGGAVFEAVLPLLNNFARVPVCGLIAHYNATDLPPGPNRLPLLMQSILVRRLTFRGFIVWDFADQHDEFLREMSAWVRDGKVHYREDITDGLEHAPRELIGLLRGDNFGKKLIRVGNEPG